jgi:tRNA(Ile)-lysidine synthetase-like protein
MKIPFRTDPTNRDLTIPRNYLRHRIIPQLQSGPAPKIRESLVRLAALAGENEMAWESLLPGFLDGVLKEDKGSVFIVRSDLLAYHPAVQTRLLREVLRRQGIEPDEAGTRVLLEFTRTGVSGRSLSLPGGWFLVREFDRFFLTDSLGAGSGESLIISGPEEGREGIVLGDKGFEIRWGRKGSGGAEARGAKTSRATTGAVKDSPANTGGAKTSRATTGAVKGSPANTGGSKADGTTTGRADTGGANTGSGISTWGGEETLEAPVSAFRFPLTVRGWTAGDRIELGYGTKKLKKLFSEAKVPLSERKRVPVLSDAEGRILWVAGVALSSTLQDHIGSGDLFFLGIRDVDS